MGDLGKNISESASARERECSVGMIAEWEGDVNQGERAKKSRGDS
jgi:hypothetical protein